jgi:hypothetical protein
MAYGYPKSLIGRTYLTLKQFSRNLLVIVLSCLSVRLHYKIVPPLR